MNALVNSHVHLEKLNEIKLNEVKQNSIEINPSKINDEYALDVGNLTFRYFGSQDSIIENLDLKFIKTNTL